MAQQAERVDWLSFRMKVCRQDTDWRDVPGVYVFAERDVTDGGWMAWYIGQADSFKDRIPNHERWDEAVECGATHVHAIVIEDEARRDSAESALIEHYQPPLNTHHR